MQTQLIAFVLMALGVGWIQPIVNKQVLAQLPASVATAKGTVGADGKPTIGARLVLAGVTGGVILIALWITLRTLEALKMEPNLKTVGV